MQLLKRLGPAEAGEWPADADRLIRANYGKLPTAKLARALGRRSLQVVGRARHLGLIPRLEVSERDLRLVRRYYDPDDPAAIRALCAVLGRPRHQLQRIAARAGVSRPKAPRWTAEDEARLMEWWGNRSEATIAQALGRTIVAVRLKAKRLGSHKRAGLDGWTARTVARFFRVDGHKVTRQWIANGWLKAMRAAWKQGANHPFVISERALLDFLRDYQHEYDVRRMDDPSGYYKRIAEGICRADPLLTTSQAAKVMGLHRHTLVRFIGEGTVPAIRSHRQGGDGLWLVKTSTAKGYRKPSRKGRLMRPGRVRRPRAEPPCTYGPWQESAALRAAGIARWRTWRPGG